MATVRHIENMKHAAPSTEGEKDLRSQYSELRVKVPPKTEGLLA